MDQAEAKFSGALPSLVPGWRVFHCSDLCRVDARAATWTKGTEWMARKQRMSVLKRQREAKKRTRERKKAEKAALKRERRHGKTGGPSMASREELIKLGILPPSPPGSEDSEAAGEDSESPSEQGGAAEQS